MSALPGRRGRAEGVERNSARPFQNTRGRAAAPGTRGSAEPEGSPRQAGSGAITALPRRQQARRGLGGASGSWAPATGLGLRSSQGDGGVRQPKLASRSCRLRALRADGGAGEWRRPWRPWPCRLPFPPEVGGTGRAGRLSCWAPRLRGAQAASGFLGAPSRGRVLEQASPGFPFPRAESGSVDVFRRLSTRGVHPSVQHGQGPARRPDGGALGTSYQRPNCFLKC